VRALARRGVASRLVFSAVLACSGCTTGEGSDAGAGAGALPQAWTLADSAAPRVGASDEDGLVLVTAAVTLPDGRIAIADAGTHRIDVFDARGRRVRSMGREGRGPGEFTHPAWIGVRGDTLQVWDMVQARLSLFDTAGRFIRTDPPVTDMGSFPRVAGQFADGSLLLAGAEREAWRNGPFRDSLLLVRMDMASGRRDTLGKVPGDEQFGSRSPDGRVSEATTLPFGRRTVLAVHGGRAYVGTGDTSAILASSDGGGWTPVAVVPIPRRRVTRQDIEDYWARLVTRGAGARTTRERPERLAYPAEYPPYGDLRTAPNGDLWVALPSRPSEWTQGGRWVVFAPRGTVRGTVYVPGRARVLEVGERAVLVSETDSDDRQLVSRYALTPPGSGISSTPERSQP
jgi:6-bladed beta-propeller